MLGVCDNAREGRIAHLAVGQLVIHTQHGHVVWNCDSQAAAGVDQVPAADVVVRKMLMGLGSLSSHFSTDADPAPRSSRLPSP